MNDTGEQLNIDPTIEPPTNDEVESAVTDTPEATVGNEPEAAAAPKPVRATPLERLAKNARDLVAEIERGSRPGFHLDRVRGLIDRLRKAEGPAEEIAALVAPLEQAEAAIVAAQAEQDQLKGTLCERAEALRESTDWKATAEEAKQLRSQWKALGSAGRARDVELWARFDGALNTFFERRAADLEQRAESRHAAQARKEALCAEAEALAGSVEWKQATERFAGLMDEWKAAGSAGREHDQALWERFGAGRSRFFERRAAHHKQVRHEQEQNRKRKEALVEEARALADAPDVAAACQRVKDLQAEWKTVGPAPREVHDSLWETFRRHCNEVFERARGEREQRQSEWKQSLVEARQRKQDQLTALRESIGRDQGHLARWTAQLKALPQNLRAPEVREGLEAKIADVIARVESKQARIGELEDALRSIETKLAK